MKRKRSRDSIPTIEQNGDNQNGCRYTPLEFASETQESRIQTVRANALSNDFQHVVAVSAPVSPLFVTSVNSQRSLSSRTFLTVPTQNIDLTPPPPPLPPSQLITFAELTNFVDCSLKGLMFTPPIVASGGILLTSTTNHPKLGQISPAIFSPGYLLVFSMNTEE